MSKVEKNEDMFIRYYLAHLLKYVIGEDLRKLLELCSLRSRSIRKRMGSMNRRGVQ